MALFLFGAVIGASAGLLVSAMCSSAGKADEQSERYFHRCCTCEDGVRVGDKTVICCHHNLQKLPDGFCDEGRWKV